MISRVVIGAMLLAGVGLFSCEPAFGQSSKAPEWTHGLELKARKSDEKDFSDKTRGYGCEAYLSRDAGILFYVTETGAITALPAAGINPPKEVKGPKWQSGMNLSVRKAGEKDFNDMTKKYGVELFQDENTGGRIYISETGSVAAVRGGGSASKSTGGPKHQYGYSLRVRKGNEDDFTPNTKKYGVEVFLDEAGGSLIYISETGAIAAVPASPIAGAGDAKKPDWLFGLNIPVRKAGEKEFDNARKWGVEVFKDDKAGNLIYIGENGDLAVVPAGNVKIPEMVKNAVWIGAGEVRVRRMGEQSFEKAKKWGIEIFRDENTGNIVAITEAGVPAVTGK
jgi:hypothetical protein